MCLPAKTLLGSTTRDFLVGPLHSAILFPKKSDAPAAPDPATERASAEAEAAQRANMQLVASNARRREQQSLMSKGATATAPGFTMGDAVTDPGANTLSTVGATTRNTTAKLASLMSRGAVSTTTGGGATYGGAGRLSQVAAR